MFRHILLATDDQQVAQKSLAATSLLAKELGSAITILRVLSPTASAAEQEKAAVDLHEVRERLAAQGVSVSTSLRDGDPAEEILAEAVLSGVDLLVMGTRGLSGLKRALLGSVTSAVIAKAPIPILLVAPDSLSLSSLETLMVPMDGSTGSKNALRVAERLAQSAGARLVLAQVVVPVSLYAYAALTEEPAAYVDPDWEQRALVEAREYVSRTAADLSAAGIRSEGVARIGDVSGALADIAQSRHADLVVMATHGRSGAARAVLGSIADEMVRESRLPILLVRQGLPV